MNTETPMLYKLLIPTRWWHYFGAPLYRPATIHDVIAWCEEGGYTLSVPAEDE